MGSFTVEVISTTTIQIVLQWDGEPANTVLFVLERATNSAFTQNLKTYSLNAVTRIFADTDRTPVSKTRFMGNPEEALLGRNTIYYYRVKAVLADGGSHYSNTVQAQVSDPIRGVEGDLWADIVLGKPDFAQNVIGHPTEHGTFFGGGVLIDKTVRPNRMYIADCNNNRILGVAYLGVTELDLSNAQNLARNKTYTKSMTPNANYPDTNNHEFTDGILSTTYTNSFAFFFSSPGTVDIDVDLGSVQEVNFAVLSSGGGSAEYKSSSLTLFVSSNGTDWTQAAQKTNSENKAEIKVLFAPVQGRYIRYRCAPQPGTAWLFIGEGKVGRLTDEQIDEEGEPCSADSDCILGNRCKLTPERGADIVLGQPDFNSSAGNGDSCAQTYPYGVPASASTLCFTLPTQISMGETITTVNMALDTEGNLYVPDIFNNRVLKYNSPFETDTIADEVWGQDDFTGNLPNKGNTNPSANSLRFFDNHIGGIQFDASGNMWVADSGNHRVLRFPKNPSTGIIAKTADIVLGQPNFTSRTEWGYSRTLAQLWMPKDVEFDTAGRLYVGDGDSGIYDGRILVFEPPFSSGMSAAREMPIPMDMELNPGYAANTTILGFSKDVVPDRFWFQKNSWTTELFDITYGESITSVLYPTSTSSDSDCDGNLIMLAKWYGTFRYRASTFPMQWSERQTYAEVAFPEGNAITNDTTGGIIGITMFGDQLIISERSRMLIWNNYDVDRITNGEPADDVYGEPDFSTIRYQNYYMSPQVDASNRLWLCKLSGGHSELQAFSYPLTNSSAPIKIIVILNGADNVLPVQGGGATRIQGDCDFAVVGTGDKIWVADRIMNRVLRINNVDGLENPSSGPYVDIVLGQESITAGEINQGGPIGPQTLAYPYNVGISPDGDLFITDNGGEVGSNRRIIQYNYNRFPNNPSLVRFNSQIGNPDRVIGTGDSFTTNGLDSQDPMCSPFELGFHPQGSIVASMNGYSGQRFPLGYIDPVANSLPQFAFGDFTSYPVVSYIDKDGNLYIGDFDWYRVLVYKKPFKKINDYMRIKDIHRIPSTENLKVIWKSRFLRGYRLYWSDDVFGLGLIWNEAKGTQANQSGNGRNLEFTDDGITTWGDALYAPLNQNVPRRFYIIDEYRQ